MKHPTATLEGANLDYAVAKALGYTILDTDHAWEIFDGEDYLGGIPLTKIDRPEARIALHTFRPSTSWSLGGPIIERERLSLEWFGGNNPPDWRASDSDDDFTKFAPTPLIAAMRCFVASKLGEEVEIP